jgi:hypothetical protein
MKCFKLITFVILIVPAMVLRAQSSYVLAGDHKITIEGSSNVHD